MHSDRSSQVEPGNGATQWSLEPALTNQNKPERQGSEQCNERTWGWRFSVLAEVNSLAKGLWSTQSSSTGINWHTRLTFHQSRMRLKMLKSVRPACWIIQLKWSRTVTIMLTTQTHIFDPAPPPRRSLCLSPLFSLPSFLLTERSACWLNLNSLLFSPPLSFPLTLSPFFLHRD